MVLATRAFWLGPRLLRIWPEFGQINEAHNGYLEIYLNLGVIGVFLLAGFLITSYRDDLQTLDIFSACFALSRILDDSALLQHDRSSLQDLI